MFANELCEGMSYSKFSAAEISPSKLLSSYFKFPSCSNSVSFTLRCSAVSAFSSLTFITLARNKGLIRAS